METFTDTHFYMTELTTFVHAVYPLGHEENSTMFNGELYQQFSYDTCGMTLSCLPEELVIPVPMNSGYSF